MALNCSFPKSQRLRKRADYLAVQRGGKTQHCRYFVVVSAQQVQKRRSGRVGITVSKKVGNAVTRNRVKRAVREFVRGAGARALYASAQASKAPAISTWLPANLDVVVIAKKAAASAPTTTLWAALESCRSRLHEESQAC